MWRGKSRDRVQLEQKNRRKRGADSSDRDKDGWIDLVVLEHDHYNIFIFIHHKGGCDKYS